MHNQLTEILIEPLVVANCWAIAREIEHDGASTPVLATVCTRRDLAQKVKIGLAKLDVDAAPIRCGHPNELLRFLVKELPHPLEHLIGARHGKRKLERVASQTIVPLRFLVWVEPADEDIVVGSVDGPLRDGRVSHLVVEIGLLPNVKEGSLSNPIRRL